MAKTKISPAEIERVRLACLRWMLSERLTAEAIARRSPWLKLDTLRRFLVGVRPSARVAVVLVETIPALELDYSPPSIKPAVARRIAS